MLEKLSRHGAGLTVEFELNLLWEYFARMNHEEHEDEACGPSYAAMIDRAAHERRV